MSFLRVILDRKREEVADAQRNVPLADLRSRAADAEPPRGFRLAIEHAPSVALIAEIKKASPSKGIIRADFDPAAIAEQYQVAGAHALSVLTDVSFFQGGLDNLKAAKRASSLPCLRKDFVYDPYQVHEARAWGADAVLLIVAMLERSQLEDLMAQATELSMDVLVETHTAREVEAALMSGADLVGVNNRNLSTFEADLAVGEELLPLVAENALAVCESAIETFHDVERARSAGAKAVLVGTTFCKAPDIAAKVREVMGWSE